MRRKNEIRLSSTNHTDGKRNRRRRKRKKTYPLVVLPLCLGLLFGTRYMGSVIFAEQPQRTSSVVEVKGEAMPLFNVDAKTPTNNGVGATPPKEATGNIDIPEVSPNGTPAPVSTEEIPWNLTLVNGKNALPADFVPEVGAVGGHSVDSRIVDSLNEMLNAAKAQGLSPIICSSYRTIERQTTLFENQVQRHIGTTNSRAEAEALAATAVAYPGTSEHNLGLAVDIVALSNQMLNDAQADTAESIWLHANCYKYGFILRYEEDKQDLTGVIYEPWHYRYVGVEVATEITERGICFEEYMDETYGVS